MKRLLLVTAICLLLPAMSHAALTAMQTGPGQVSLAWDPSVSVSVTGYYVHFGNASRNYGTKINVGNVTAFTVSGLSTGMYFFAVSAYDDYGHESGFSNEVSTPVTAPLIIDYSYPATILVSTAVDISPTVTGGAPGTMVFTVESGSFPPGMILETATGRLAGDINQAGIYDFTIKVTDSAGSEAFANITMNAELAPPTGLRVVNVIWAALKWFFTFRWMV